jgi:hypothetical protein
VLTLVFTVVDPNFSLLLESEDSAGCGPNSKSDNKKLIIEIAVPVAIFVVALIIALVVVVPRLELHKKVLRARRRTKGQEESVELGSTA